ncbi:MAG: alpha/beta hydrolase [Deltaproteobacteria bacterium]|nr:alpha/beta hydrolase [Deltaproteobacteria bacterium]
MPKLDRLDELLAYRLDLPDKPCAGDPAILYLHGFGSTQQGEKAEFFRRQALEEGFAFCSFDFQGHGESGGEMGELTLSRNLLDMERMHRELERRGFPRVIVLGSSLGGLTGMWFCAQHPDKVAAGLYLAPAVDLAETAETWFGEEGLKQWQEQGSMKIRTDLVDCEMGWSFIEDLRAHPISRLVRQHQTPALLLMGKKDTSVSWQRVAAFATESVFEELELHLFSDGDHRLLDRKERLWQLMQGFLRDKGLLG